MEHSLPTLRTRSIRDTRLGIQNKYHMNKWLHELCNEEGLWQDLLRNKYLKHRTLSQTSKKKWGIHIFGQA